MQNALNPLFLYFLQIWQLKRKIFVLSLTLGCIGILISKTTQPRYETYVIIALEDFQKSNSTNNSLSYNGIQNNAYSYIFSSTPFLRELLKIPIDLSTEINGTRKKSLNDFLTQLYSHKIIKENNNGLISPKEEFKNIEYLKKHIRISVSISKSELTIYSTFPSAIVSAVVADSATQKLSQYITNYYTFNKKKEYLHDLKILSIKDSIYQTKIKTYANYKDKNIDINKQINKIKDDSLFNELQESKQIYEYIFKETANAEENLFNEKKNFRVIQPAIIPETKSNLSLSKYFISFFLLGIISSSFGIIFIRPISTLLKNLYINKIRK